MLCKINKIKFVHNPKDGFLLIAIKKRKEEEMKINMYIFVLIFLSVCILPVSQLNAEDKICNNFSDSEWIIWFADSLDMNAEIGEMRNEYIFCRLQSEDAESFIEFLYYVINEKNKRKITKELQMPIHNDIDINRCKYNVSKSKTDRRFKKWLMNQLNHIEKF